MNPTLYALCQKPVIGVAMWLSSLCVFPPLISPLPFPLTAARTSVSTEFKVPVDRRYSFWLTFEFPSSEARLSDEIVGSRYDENCRGEWRYQDIPTTRRVGLGRPIALQVVVRRKADRRVVIDRVFESLCVTGHVDNKKSRTIGQVDLTTGDYIAEVTNIDPQGGLDGVTTSLSLGP